MRVVFIIHGAKKSLKKLPQILTAQRPQDFQFYFCYTSNYGSGKQLAYENASKADIIAVSGGDGILNESLNGIMMYRRENPGLPYPAITLLPFGSGNDFARGFNWKRKSVPDFITRIKKRNFRQIDLGSVTAENGRVEYFINEASTGFSTRVVKHVVNLPSDWGGNLKFGWSILLTFFTYKKEVVTLESDDFSWSGKSLLVACCNGKYFGSGVVIAPDAELNDGLLDVVVLGNVNFFHYLYYVRRMKRGIKINHPEVHYYKTKQLKISGTGTIEKEGELGSKLPCTIKIADTFRILD